MAYLASRTSGCLTWGPLGKSIDLAGDELTEPQVAEVFSRVVGRPVRLTEPQGQWSNNPEAQKMRRWMNEVGYTADIPSLRKIHHGLITLENYLRRNGWENAEPAAVEAAWPARS